MQREITSIINFCYKNVKFCIVVVHDLTNDISYDVKLNRSKIWFFGMGRVEKFICKNREKGKIVVVYMFDDILV